MKRVKTISYEVLPQHSAASVGSGLLEVLSTPSLLGFLENAALELMAEDLTEEQSQVGIEANLQHLAPTAIGKMVSITAKLVEQKGKIYEFELEAFEGKKLIATASHKRAIVNIEKFMKNIED